MRAQPPVPRLRGVPTLSAHGALIALLVACSSAAWLVSAQLTSADMQAGLLTSPLVGSSADRIVPMGMPSLGAFVGMWALMVVAMMFPALWPVARAIDATRRTAQQGFAVTLRFITGYLLAWSAVGPAAYLAMGLVNQVLPMGSVVALRGGAILLLVAGAYQLTPLKGACLRQCHSPDAQLISAVRLRPARGPAALSRGLAQGAYCLGSTWPLMMVLLLLGMMHLAWMGAVAVVILLEKALPSGRAISKAVGIVLITIGILVIAAPHPLTALVSHLGQSHVKMLLYWSATDAWRGL